MKNRLFMLALQLVVAAELTATQYQINSLVTDPSGSGPHLDPNLINPWGLFFVPSGDFWVADNGTNVSTVYKPNGTTPIPYVVNVDFNPSGALFNGSANCFFNWGHA